jgi:hypothetical protein
LWRFLGSRLDSGVIAVVALLLVKPRRACLRVDPAERGAPVLDLRERDASALDVTV